MATPRKRMTKKLSAEGRTARSYRFARGDETTARAKRAAEGATRKSPRKVALGREGREAAYRFPRTTKKAATKKAARKTAAKRAAPTTRRAPLIPPHAASPRPGKKCKLCGKAHTRRAHGSHAKGKKIPFTYKTRREGIFARAGRAIRKMAAKKPSRKRAARRAT